MYFLCKLSGFNGLSKTYFPTKHGLSFHIWLNSWNILLTLNWKSSNSLFIMQWLDIIMACFPLSLSKLLVTAGCRTKYYGENSWIVTIYEMLEGKSDDTHVIRELRFVLGDSFFLQATHALGPIFFVQLE